MSEMLELPGRDFRITIINMEKVDNNGEFQQKNGNHKKNAKCKKNQLKWKFMTLRKEPTRLSPERKKKKSSFYRSED